MSCNEHPTKIGLIWPCFIDFEWMKILFGVVPNIYLKGGKKCIFIPLKSNENKGILN